MNEEDYDRSYKTYLGDGAYVQQGSYIGEVILTTEDGISVQNRIVLGSTEIHVLLHWLEQWRQAHKRRMEESE